MGRLKAQDSDGKEVWIHDSYLDNFLERELDRISKDDCSMSYYFGHWESERNKKLIEENKILRGEVSTLQKTKEEKAEEELFIQNFVKTNEVS